MKSTSKIALILFVFIVALILSPVSTVLAINYEAQINVGFPSGSILLVGDTTVLRIDILNTNPFILENVSFTDSLEVNSQTGLVVHSDGVLENTCNGIVVADPGSTKIALSGGQVPAASGVTQGECHINIRLLATSPGTKQSYVPSYGNEPSWGGAGLYATARGGLDIITNATRAASITTLTVNPVTTPSMDKNFSPTTVWAGESTQLEINLTNNDTTNSLTGVTYTDTLPSPFVVSSPLTTSISGCGSGTITTSVGSNTITLSNGTIAPSALCRIRVRVVSSTQGTYTNIIPAGPDGAGSLQTDQYVTNPTDVSAPVNVQSVSISKAFSPDSFAQGDTSTLTITLRNPSSTTYTAMHFDDTLPGPLVVSGTPAASQCGGTVSVSSDKKTITLDGGTIPPGNTTTPGSCTVVVQVTSPTSGGPYTNTIPAGALTGSVTNLLPASDDATVVTRTIGVVKDFAADFVENGTTTLTITLKNQASTAFTGVYFTDTMPANVTIVGTPTASSSCGTSAVVSSTSDSVTLTNGVIPAGSVATPGTCTITATVTSSVVNTSGYSNSIAAGDVCSAQSICNASSASDTVRVYAIGGNATVSKSFATSPTTSPVTVLPGNDATLTITIRSPRDTGLSQIHLLDNFPGDMVLTSTPATTCHGTLSGDIGSQYIELTNGYITGTNSTCTITAKVTAYTPGTHTNTIPANSLTTYEGRTDTSNRSASLSVTSFKMTKQFAPAQIAPGGHSLLTIFLRNSSLQPITGVTLSDVLSNMDQSSTGYTVRVYRPGDSAYEPTTDCTGGTITAINGASSISLSGATVPASDGSVDGLCRLNVYVTGDNTSGALVSRTNTVPISNVTGTINGSTTISPISSASAALDIEPIAITVDKAFSPLSVYNGSYSTMTIELRNSSSTAALSQIQFTDNMPAGMVLATPVSASVGTCGGSISANPGEQSFSFSGGSLPAGGSCTLSLHVTMTVTGNLVNTINAGDVTSFEGASNSNTEQETLTNAVGAYILKSFSPNPIQVGGVSTLSIQIFNTSTTTDLTGMGANDNLPDGITIYDDGLGTDPIVENTCGGTLLTDVHTSGTYTGRSYINLTNGTIPANSSCIMRVNVTSAVAGTYNNIIVSDDVTPPIDPENAHDTLYVTSFSLGNRVWDDNGAGGGTANDGVKNGGEPGISGLEVNLYRDSNNDGSPDGSAIATTTTGTDGYYRFDGLSADTYIVEVKIPDGYVRSAVNGGDPDSNATDNDNNGVDLSHSGYIRSYPVTLEPTAIEPTNDNDPVTNPESGEGPNNQSNRTVDFGFYRPFSLGNRVWNDNGSGTGGVANNGIQDGTEPGISGVTVRLYLDANADDIKDGSAISVTTTDANGYYRFDNLPTGSYIVEVVTPAGYRITSNADNNPNNDEDLDNNGYVVSGVNVRSNHVTLGDAAVEPTGETDPLTNPESGEAPDNQSNRTVDFGFINAYSLGNRVWNDNGSGTGGTANNGIQDGTEPGMGGVTVNLYQDSAGDGTPDGGIIRTAVTDSSGYYRFDNLAPDTYIVEVVLPTGYQASPNPYDPAVNDPDIQEVDLDNNGVVSGTGVIRSNPVTLSGGSEPTGDNDPSTNPQTGEAPDAFSNRTVDFGLYAAPLSLGNLVWLDNGSGTGGVANNGIHDGTEPGLAGVTVKLYRESNLTSPLAITETDSNGNYLFNNLAADTYRVEIIIPGGYTRSSVYNPASPTDTTDDDNNGANLNASSLTSNPIELSADNLTIDFGLVQLASLGDRVWYDTNRNGVQDSGEAGVTGVTVKLYTGTPGSGSVLSTTTTSGGGYYHFSNLEPRSDYYLEFTLPANYAFSPSGAGTSATDSDVTTVVTSTGRTVAIDLSAFENDLTWDAGIYLPPASIGDKVWNDNGSGTGGVARDGLQNGDEPGVSGVKVDLFRPGVGADGIPDTPDDALSVAYQYTDSNGNYLFDELLPGNYYVGFTLPDGYAFTLQNTGGDDALDSDADTSTGKTITTALSAGEADLTWDAGLYQLASLGDFVWNDNGGGTPANAYNGVQDSGETGIQGVTVNLYNASNTLVASTATGSLGQYLFSNLEPGDYYVEFIPPSGYSISPKDAGGNDAVDSDADTSNGKTITTTLVAGENDMTWDAGMYQYAAIGDRVWDDNGTGGGTPRNGIQDGTEPGVAGVTVTLYNSSDVQVGSPVTTDTNGLYAFSKLVPGDYYVVFSNLPSGYQFSPLDAGADDTKDSDAATSTGKTTTTTLSPGENDVTWDAGIHLQTAALGDFVWYDINGNGIQDSGETPFENVTVTLYDAFDQVVATQTTGSDGKYLFSSLNPGYYYVVFTAPTGYEFTLTDQGSGPTQDQLDSDAIIPLGRTNLTQLTPGETDLTWDAGLYTKASLGNFVWQDWNMDGIQDDRDTGINGVSVELFRVGFGSVATTTTANLNGDTNYPGYYLFDNLVPGDYYVVFTLPSGYKFTTQGSGASDTDSNPNASGQTPTVTLGSGDTNLTIDAGLIPLFSLGNRVWYDTDNDGTLDSGEAGISGVTVQLYDSSGTTEILVGSDGVLGTADDGSGGVLTDSTGHYLFNNLPPGNYRVVLPASNFSGVLDGYWSSYSVRNNTGSVVETSSNLANNDTDSDDNGDYSSSRVISSVITLGQEYPAAEPTGETDLGTQGQGGRPDTYGNMTVDFGFYHIRLGNLVWNDVDNNGVVNGSDAGINGVTVQLWSGDGSSMIDSTTTAGGGIYSFDGLPAGSYFIRIPKTEFEGSETLRDFRSSTGGGSEPAPNPNSDTDDSDDNGQETGGTLGLGGYIQTPVFTLTAGAGQSSDNSTGLTTEYRIDLGLYDAPQVDLKITKDDGQTFYITGSTLTYDIEVTNNGPADMTGAVVSDSLPAQFSSWTWTCDAGTDPSYLCNGGTAAPFSDTINLPYGASILYHVEAIVSATATGQLDNTAVITPPTGVTETNNSNNSATDSDLPAYLTISKDDGVEVAAPGSVLTYHVTVTNGSAVDLANLVITDTLTDDVTFIRSYQGASTITPTTITGNVITWDKTSIPALGNLPISGSIEFDIEVQVVDTPVNPSITNSIHIEDTVIGANDDDTDTDTILVTNGKTLIATSEGDSGTASPALPVNPEPVFIGEILTYRITLDIPTGTAGGLQAVDILDQGLAFVECTDIQAGSALSTDLVGGFAAACASPTVAAEPSGSLDTINQGRRVQFDLGNVTSTGITNNTLTITYEAVVLDIVSNANGVDNLNNRVTWTWDTVNSISHEATPVTIDEPELAISKKAQPTVATYGTPINFTLDVSHTTASTAPAYDVILKDVLPSGLKFVTGSVATTGLAPTSYDYDAATATLTFNWDTFPLGSTSTINFQAVFAGPSPVRNEASVEWTSLAIDPTLAGTPEQRSTYNIHSTERWYDPTDQTINDYDATSAIEISVPGGDLPKTGFIPGVQNEVPVQPADKAYQDMNEMLLEIPEMNIKLPIMGVPYTEGGWDLTWLTDEAGYLEGTTFPGQVGNSALTAHVVLADGTPGPFEQLNKLAWGDQIILHIGGQKYIYELRYNLKVKPNDYSMFYYDGYSWLTLITCDDYDKYTNNYLYRTLVKAVLVKVEPE